MQDVSTTLSRRALIKTIGVAAGAAALAPSIVRAQAPAGTPMAPPTTITTPPRDFGPGGAPTTYFSDPDVLTVEPEFNGLRQPNTPIAAPRGPARCGRRDRRGAARAATSCGATSRTIASCAGSRTTAA